MQKFDIAILGGGAAGIIAAISAGRKGKKVVICEKMPQLGKKILISGAGIVVTFLNKIGVTYGGSNVFLTIIVFYFAIASVYTTFKYHKIG